MGRSVTLGFSRRADGDLQIGGDPAQLTARRARVAPGEWTWLHQVHGNRVVVVDQPGAHAGAEADAAVTTATDAVLAVHTADCVPVLLSAEADEVIGAAHVGWRGLVAGVLEGTVAAMGRLGAGAATAVVGPHIRARCYEFGTGDLDAVAARYGDRVRSTTAWGTPSLDLLAGIRSALEALGVTVVDAGGCTACEPGSYFSHRARNDAGRQAATIALRAPASDSLSEDGAGEGAP